MTKKLPPVHCRICKNKIDRNTTIENIDWIMTSKNWFFHKKCYEEWAQKKNDVHTQADDELWLNAAWDYLSKDLKIQCDFVKIKKQWENCIKKGYTPKGIYFCIRYFYEYKKGDVSKSKGGIGIVPYIYSESCAYWRQRELKESGICEKITQQIKESQYQKKIKIKQEKNKKKLKYNLSQISEMGDN